MLNVVQYSLCEKHADKLEQVTVTMEQPLKRKGVKRVLHKETEHVLLLKPTRRKKKTARSFTSTPRFPT